HLRRAHLRPVRARSHHAAGVDVRGGRRGIALAGLTLFRALGGGSSPLRFTDAAEIAFGNLLLLLLVPPLHARIAAAIKRSLTRHPYSSRRELARFGDALGGAQTIEGVRRALSDTLSHTINPVQHHLY